jgi:hypothetical protein
VRVIAKREAVSMRAFHVLALAIALVVPAASRATGPDTQGTDGAGLADDETVLVVPDVAPPRPLRLALAIPADGQPASGGEQKADNSATANPGTSLDFDLLGASKPPPMVDDGALRLRRRMLTVHQGVGIGLFGLQLATTVVGQLNYNDRFANGPSTGRYESSHAILAYSTLAAFASAGALALLAPSPLKRSDGWDRARIHKWSMATAAAGMLAQGVLGIATAGREGHANQSGLATAHLAIGYVTLAAVTAGVSALVF